jgi:hypothetical protein
MEVPVSAKELENYRKQARIVVILGIIVILAGAYLIFSEIKQARDFCESVQGKPSLTGRTCNGEPLAKYSDGWDFERMDISQIQNISINWSQP